MNTLNKLSIRLYRRLFGVPDMAAVGADNEAVVMDGGAAVATTETAIADAIALGGSQPALLAELAWLEGCNTDAADMAGGERLDDPKTHCNVFGGLLNTLVADSPRGALAAAVGQAMSGCRAGAFLSGVDAAATQDLFRSAAGRRLPLVVHLINRAVPAHGETPGSGHEAIHLTAESGWFVITATNVQEAVDFTLIARKVAELTLTPAVVAMDNEQTTQALQNVHLLSAETIVAYLGPADSIIPTPTPAQQMLFGEQRRQMPRLHDLDRPVLQGARQNTESYALGAMAVGPFFDEHFDGILHNALNEFAKLTGRRYSAISSYRVDESDRVLLAQGSAVEAARVVADRLSGNRKKRVGVIGIHSLRPFPGPDLVKQLTGKRWVAVMERLVSPLNATTPLLREVRSAFDCALENGSHGEDCNPGYPVLEASQRPRLQSVLYGVGGLPLSGPDLFAMIDRLEQGKVRRLYLGMKFHGALPQHPKRQVMLDQLRRAYPACADIGVVAEQQSVEGIEGMIALVFHHQGDATRRMLSAGVGALLQRLRGGMLRSTSSLYHDHWQSGSIDLLVHRDAGQCVTDAANTADMVLLEADATHHADLTKGVNNGAALLFIGTQEQAGIWQQSATPNQAAVARLALKLYRIPNNQTENDHGISTDEMEATWLTGGILGVLISAGILDFTLRKVLNAWRQCLGYCSDRQRELLLAHFETAVQSVQTMAPVDRSDAPVSENTWNDEPPHAVRHLGGNDHSNQSLPRFWGQVGVLNRNGEQGKLTADPYMATGTMPPLSATFQDRNASRDSRIVFHAANCNACGNCFRICPDSAIGIVAITPTRLIDAAIQHTSAAALQPMASKLGARINAMGRKKDFTGTTASVLLGEAWDWLKQKASLQQERQLKIEAAMEHVCDWLGELPLVVTDNVFHAGEKANKDSGELLSLVINPDSCKACRLCVVECDQDALETASPDPESLQSDKRLWRLWEQIPDTESRTVERLLDGNEIGNMAAAMMSRDCSHALSGGDIAEAGSGERLAVRLLLATAEYRRRPLMRRFADQIGETKTRIDAMIRNHLADSLSTDDFDLLAAALDGADNGEFDIGGLVKSAGGGIDTGTLQRLTEVARELHDRYRRYSQGEYGLSRYGYGLVLASGSVCSWAAAFPDNPFQTAVTVDMTGDAGQLSAGLVREQVLQTVRTIAVLARADILLGDSRDAIARNSWENLSDEQRRLCAPLLLVGCEKELGGRGLAQIVWLLNSRMPVKVLMLSELDLGLDNRGVKATPLDNLNDPRSDLALLALAQRSAYVAQSSIADPDHFFQSVSEALHYAGPALIRVYAPSPGRHGLAPDRTLAQAALAVESRVMPLFRYHPEAEGVFGSCLDLEGNGDIRADWLENEFGVCTPANWALGEKRFNSHMHAVSEMDSSLVELADWLALDNKARGVKTPMVTVAIDERRLHYRISHEFAERIVDLSDSWRMLQELAGVVTPFTEQVRREADAAVAEAHEAQLDALKTEYEGRLKQQAEGMQAEMAVRIRQRLINLAGFH